MSTEKKNDQKIYFNFIIYLNRIWIPLEKKCNIHYDGILLKLTDNEEKFHPKYF